MYMHPDFLKIGSTLPPKKRHSSADSEINKTTCR
jgi:hypothetical protein